ncbi:hypothetical protein COO60DRAFT_1504016, partial [Scenedesmus sp. NREL 46B-D3]
MNLCRQVVHFHRELRECCIQSAERPGLHWLGHRRSAVQWQLLPTRWQRLSHCTQCVLVLHSRSSLSLWPGSCGRHAGCAEAVRHGVGMLGLAWVMLSSSGAPDERTSFKRLLMCLPCHYMVGFWGADIFGRLAASLAAECICVELHSRMQSCLWP